MKRKKPKAEAAAQQLWDGVWYRIDDNYLHECCDCGLVHDVSYKLEKGTLFMRWNVDAKSTAAARRLRRKAIAEG